MRVLGIETSCDETGVAVYDSREGLLAHALHSQVDLHAAYGGVVPELASRDHIRKLLPMIEAVLGEAGTSAAGIDGVAYTAGPGLIGALLVGACVGRGLALAWDRPAVGIHHMEGHLLSPMLEDDSPEPPYVALLVSGGHTLLARVDGVGRYGILGESLDDAAGEAFDKTAKLLGLPYPGGPALAALAENGEPGRFRLPRPMLDRPGLDFSFSGLKTAVMVALKDSTPDDGPPSDETRRDLAREFEEAVVDTLVTKSIRALDATGLDELVIAGGVGANRRLRRRLAEACDARGARARYPRLEFCTDNGAMIAYAGMLRLMGGDRADLAIDARARWSLESLRPPGDESSDGASAD